MPRKTSTKNETKPKRELCFISKELETEYLKGLSRAFVCPDLSPDYKDEDGNHFCILHYPSADKHMETNFESVLREKLDKQQNDFQYVYFTNGGVFWNRTILSDIDFSYAVFSGEALFEGTKFKGSASFKNARFIKEAKFGRAEFDQRAEFDSAMFYGETSFGSVKFKDQVSFTKSTFESKTGFRETLFSDVAWFDDVIFNEKVDFTCADFSSVAEFNKSTFNNEVYFTSVSFLSQAKFLFSTFSNFAYFTSTNFDKNVFFNFSKFTDEAKIYFIQTLFNEAVSFVKADINGYLHFEGGEREVMKEGVVKNEGITNCFDSEESSLDLEHARIANAEKISFHLIRLQPSWFINIDCRKINFTASKWKQVGNRNISTDSELQVLKDKGISSPNANKLLTKTCLQLADNHEENKSFSKASIFRQIANESKRLEDNNGLKIWSLHWWYWLSSFYGEKPLWAGIVLFLILTIFAGGMMIGKFQVCPIDKPVTISLQQNLCEERSLYLGEAISQSLATAIFQTNDYRKPISGWGETWMILEKVLAPLQAALLALAIRRKFMR